MADIERIEQARLVHERGIKAIEREIGRRIVEPITALKLVHDISRVAINPEDSEDHDLAYEILNGRLNETGALKYMDKVYDPLSPWKKFKWMLRARAEKQPSQLHSSLKWGSAMPLIEQSIETTEVSLLIEDEQKSA
jgi:hypothetical protein